MRAVVKTHRRRNGGSADLVIEVTEHELASEGGGLEDGGMLQHRAVPRRSDQNRSRRRHGRSEQRRVVGEDPARPRDRRNDRAARPLAPDPIRA